MLCAIIQKYFFCRYINDKKSGDRMILAFVGILLFTGNVLFDPNYQQVYDFLLLGF